MAAGMSFGLTVLEQVEAFRATMLRLALADFHREHGHLPESLSELAPTYFENVPRDPQTAGPFVYFPHGVPEDVTHEVGGRGDIHVIVRKETPFLVTTYGEVWPQARQKPDGSWQFTDYLGKSLELSAALLKVHVWLIEPDDPKRDP